MEFLSTLISNEFSDAIGTSLVHSIWQISLIGLALFFLRNMSGMNHNFRYWSALVALFMSIAVCIGTFVMSYYNNITNSIGSSLNAESTASDLLYVEASQMGLMDKGLYQLSIYQDVVVGLWFIGFIALILHFCFGLFQTKQIKASAQHIHNEKLMSLFNSLKAQMNISKNVRLAESAKINTAMVAGFWKPIILFPVCLVNQLDAEELKSILAHELAHIKRNDFIVNLFQTVAELILYFHPVIWWISNIINEEREICCDDFALNITDDNHAYAKALLKLQQYRITNQTLPLTLAFSGNKSEFKNRILRILNQPLGKQLNKERGFAILALLIFAFAFRYTDDVVHNADIENCNIEECISLCEDQTKETEIKIVILDSGDIQTKESKIQTTKQKTIKTVFQNANKKQIRLKASIDTIPNKKKIKKYSFHITDDNSIDSFIIKGDDSYGMIIDSILNSIPNDFEFQSIDSLYTRAIPNQMIEEFIEMKELKNHLKQKDIHILSDENALVELLGENEFDIVYPDHLEDLMDESKLKFKFYDQNDLKDLHLFKSQQATSCNKTGLFKDDLSTAVSKELYEDGFIENGDQFKVEITAKHFKINGEKQPSNIKNKYTKIFEDNLGFQINKESKIVIESNFEKTNNIF